MNADREHWKDRPLEPGDRAVAVNPFNGKALELVAVVRVAEDGVYVENLDKPYNPAVLVHRDVWDRWPEAAWESVKRRTRHHDRRGVAL